MNIVKCQNKQNAQYCEAIKKVAAVKLKEGGRIPKAGLYKLHKCEVVVPAVK